MGRGNVCVHGPCEGLFYIDKDYLDVYMKYDSEEDCFKTKTLGELSYQELTGGEWEFDDVTSRATQECILDHFMEEFCKVTPSFQRCTKQPWRDSQQILLENGLFYIAIEDNEWSLAVELIQKEDPYTSLCGLQWWHYQTYINKMLAVLLNQLPSVGTYGGPWTSGRVTREDI